MLQLAVIPGDAWNKFKYEVFNRTRGVQLYNQLKTQCGLVDSIYALCRYKRMSANETGLHHVWSCTLSGRNLFNNLNGKGTALTERKYIMCAL